MKPSTDALVDRANAIAAGAGRQALVVAGEAWEERAMGTNDVIAARNAGDLWRWLVKRGASK